MQNDGTPQNFLADLWEACERAWVSSSRLRLDANHYPLLLESTEANLFARYGLAAEELPTADHHATQALEACLRRPLQSDSG